MKKDMDKLLVTTARIGSSLKNSEVKRHRRTNEKDYENLPSYSSMKPKGRRYEERKQLNEYLNPLIRFLRKNCNRPWEKVYSEICENLDRRTAVQNHIFDHLFDYVETKPIFIENKPYHRYRWGEIRIYKTGYSFYVDRAGFLREPKDRRPHRIIEERNDIKIIDDSIYVLRKEDNIWFEFLIVDEYFYQPKLPEWMDNLLPFPIKCKLARKNWKLRSLSKSEKKRLGL